MLFKNWSRIVTSNNKVTLESENIWLKLTNLPFLLIIRTGHLWLYVMTTAMRQALSLCQNSQVRHLVCKRKSRTSKIIFFFFFLSFVLNVKPVDYLKTYSPILTQYYQHLKKVKRFIAVFFLRPRQLHRAVMGKRINEGFQRKRNTEIRQAIFHENLTSKVKYPLFRNRKKEMYRSIKHYWLFIVVMNHSIMLISFRVLLRHINCLDRPWLLKFSAAKTFAYCNGMKLEIKLSLYFLLSLYREI